MIRRYAQAAKNPIHKVRHLAASLILALGLGLVGCAATNDSTDAAPASLNIINESQAPICNVYFSLNSDTAWGGDQLASGEEIAAGATHSFDITAGDYDVRVEDCNQDMLLQEQGISISGVYDLPIPAVERGAATLRIVNEGEQAVCYVFISSTGDSNWGDDHLGLDEKIELGSSRSFALADNTYDILVLNCNQEPLQEERDVSITDTYELRLVQPEANSNTQQ